MTVTDHIENDEGSVGRKAAASVTIDEQAVAELAQELKLVARSLFAQLLPSTATRAVSGVPGLGTSVLAGGFPAAPTTSRVPETDVPVTLTVVPSPTVAAPTLDAAVAVPVTTAAAVPVPALAVAQVPQPPEPSAHPPTSVPLPGAIPVPTLAAVPDAPETSDAPSAALPKPEHVSLAMLEEIGFLDE